MDYASIAAALSEWQVGILMRLSNEWTLFPLPRGLVSAAANLVNADLIEYDHVEDTARLTELGEQVKQVIIELRISFDVSFISVYYNDF